MRKTKSEFMPKSIKLKLTLTLFITLSIIALTPSHAHIPLDSIYNHPSIKSTTESISNLNSPESVINTIFHETTNKELHSSNEQSAINRGDTSESIFRLNNYQNYLYYKNNPISTAKLTTTEWNNTHSNSSILLEGNITNYQTKLNSLNGIGSRDELGPVAVPVIGIAMLGVRVAPVAGRVISTGWRAVNGAKIVSTVYDSIGDIVDGISVGEIEPIVNMAKGKNDEGTDSTSKSESSNSSSNGGKKNDEYKTKKSHVSGKDGAKDTPSWARGEKPFKNENGEAFAKRLMKKKYGDNFTLKNATKEQRREFSKIHKYGDRSF